MKRFFSKTYRFGRLSLSSVYDEWMLLYRGESRVIVKRAKKDVVAMFSKRLMSVSLVLVMTITVVFSIAMNPDLSIEPLASEETEELSDEEKKDKILFSSDTDYSQPKKNIALEIKEHVVKSGETLSQIARKYGVSMGTICGCSGLRSYDLIRVGTRLKIPNKDGIIYKLKKGQSVLSIARRYKASIRKIIAENNIKNPDFFNAGEYLFIPDAKPQNIMPGFLWPAMSRRLTCGYGWRRHPIRRYRHFHQGIDIRSVYQWVRSVKYGKVTYAGWMGGYGRAVIVAHPGGWKSLYGHLSRISVRRGQHVKQGQYIGKSGNTGLSTGPHLHFELIKNGRHKNPRRYLK